MAETAILFRSAKTSGSTAQVWLARAQQARRLALMLSAEDAKILETYAAECEAQVRRLTKQRRSPLAA
jgi:hypothetical protein